MDCARRFPPGIAGVKRLLGSIADLRDNSAGNDECHDAIDVTMRWGTCCRWIGHFDQADISEWRAGKFLRITSRRVAACEVICCAATVPSGVPVAASKENKELQLKCRLLRMD